MVAYALAADSLSGAGLVAANARLKIPRLVALHLRILQHRCRLVVSPTGTPRVRRPPPGSAEIVYSCLVARSGQPRRTVRSRLASPGALRGYLRVSGNWVRVRAGDAGVHCLLPRQAVHRPANRHCFCRGNGTWNPRTASRYPNGLAPFWEEEAPPPPFGRWLQANGGTPEIVQAHLDGL